VRLRFSNQARSNGKAISIRNYLDPKEALEAVGLRE
jgi:hypothetical protein